MIVDMLLTIVVFLLILSVLVLVHELGHFLVAKKLGVKVEEFGFGFPPRIWGKKIGETLYSINLLPIGGFVKLYGEDNAGGGKIGVGKAGQVKDIKRAFYARPVWQRGAIVVAGVVMNFLLAVCIISYLFAVQGVSTPGNTVQIIAISPNSPAAQAGLKAGEIVKSINGTILTSPNQMISYIKSHLGQQVSLVIGTSNGQGGTQIIQVTPRVHYPANEGAMGVVISNTVTVKRYPWYQAPFVGLQESFSETWLILQGLWATIVTVSQRQVPQGLAGPVGIAQLTGQFIKIGPDAVLSLVSLLSLNLAVLNVLPIPALDGGRLFFILVETVTRKKVNPKFEAYTHAIGMIFLLSLIALITFHDLVRIFTNQPLLPK